MVDGELPFEARGEVDGVVNAKSDSDTCDHGCEGIQSDSQITHYREINQNSQDNGHCGDDADQYRTEHQG